MAKFRGIPTVYRWQSKTCVMPLHKITILIYIQILPLPPTFQPSYTMQNGSYRYKTYFYRQNIFILLENFVHLSKISLEKGNSNF